MTLDTMGPFRKQETNRFIGTCLASYSTMEIWHKIQTPFSWQNFQLERDEMTYIPGVTFQNMHATQWCLINSYIIAQGIDV